MWTANTYMLTSFVFEFRQEYQMARWFVILMTFLATYAAFGGEERFREETLSQGPAMLCVRIKPNLEIREFFVRDGRVAIFARAMHVADTGEVNGRKNWSSAYFHITAL